MARKPDPETFATLPRAPLHLVLADASGLANMWLVRGAVKLTTARLDRLAHHAPPSDSD